MALMLKDDDGEEVRAGDMIVFSFGIPPTRVEARIVERDGNLIALTPEHTPKETKLRSLRRYIGNWYKLHPRTVGEEEIEAKLFHARPHHTG